MIEREVLVPKERPLVAAVIYNRLAQGIPLGIDATLRYDLDNFDKPLTESDLATAVAVQHATRAGAAADADRQPRPRLAEGRGGPGRTSTTSTTSSSPDTCGEHYFTDDYDDFLAASDKYNSARAAEGGSPTDC